MRMIGRGQSRWAALACSAVLVTLAAAGCTGTSATPQIIYITPSPGPVTPLPSGVTPAPTPAPPTPTPAPPTPIIGSAVISSNAPDNRWTVTFKKPIVSGIPAASATRMNDAITAQVDSYVGAFTGSGLPTLASGAGPSTLEGDFSIALASPTLISLRFTLLTYVTGAAHPVGTPGSINFVVSSGATINFTDIFVNPTAALTTLSTQARASLSAQLGSDLTWPGPANSISFFDKAWAMTPAGLEFSWPQGDLASMAAGMPTATLRWSAIKSLIKPAGPAGEFVR